MTSKNKTLFDNKKLQKALITWYLSNLRPLPWRESRDPYKIWISEIMLQQTTVAAVVPFFERFIKRFPDIESLAKAPLEDVYEKWSGLGYYSRARNIHKTAKEIDGLGYFPSTWSELINLPGLGPYSARSIASIAFGELVGVVDGNVIRVLSRLYGKGFEWWKTSERKELQKIADGLCKYSPEIVKEINLEKKSASRVSKANFSSLINQGLMELGASLCSPTSPACALCPWSPNCLARKNGSINNLPLSKPQKAKEIWVWSPEIHQDQKNKLAFIENNYAPFLRGQWIYPGKVAKKSEPPKNFDFKHSITHHEIYVKISNKTSAQSKPKSVLASKKKSDFQKNNSSELVGARWILPSSVVKLNPTSLVQKVLQRIDHKNEKSQKLS